LNVRAPGKVVLWGEYAVLTGAPAAVMAVNRYAAVDLKPGARHTRFSSKGFLTPGVYKADDRFCRAPTAAMAETVLRECGYTNYPIPFELLSDTRAFFADNGAKLGIGSSAALCTATYVAFCRLLELPASEQGAIAAHRAFQGGKGSGLDVAASWHGGVIRYENGAGTPWTWPADLHWRIIWTGTSASTLDSLGDFSAWRRQGNLSILDDLQQSCTALFEEFDLEGLHSYCSQLQALDADANLNIFTPGHQRLATIASAQGLVYKPCGAGGGDIGFACGDDVDALEAFAAAAATEQFVPLDLEIANHGVRAG
jgi:phosphomevalonate kinase